MKSCCLVVSHRQSFSVVWSIRTSFRQYFLYRFSLQGVENGILWNKCLEVVFFSLYFCDVMWRIALCRYPHVQWSIRISNQSSTTAPIFQQSHYFRQNIWVNICVQFHFQVSIYICGTSWLSEHMNDIRHLPRTACLWYFPAWSPV